MVNKIKFGILWYWVHNVPYLIDGYEEKVEG